jgi:hypothetical protein
MPTEIALGAVVLDTLVVVQRRRRALLRERTRSSRT